MRRGRETRTVALEGAAEAVAELCVAALRSCPDGGAGRMEAAVSPRITKRRLFGIDRSGPPPAATLSNQPLHPWTIPNAIGFARAARRSRCSSCLRCRAPRAGHGRHGPVCGDRLERLPGRVRGAADGSVQPARRAAGPDHRPAAGDLGDGRLLALLAAAAVGDRARRRPRAVDAAPEPLRAAAGAGAADQLARPARGGADDGRAVLRDGRRALAGAGAALLRPGAVAIGDRAVRPRRARAGP